MPCMQWQAACNAEVDQRLTSAGLAGVCGAGTSVRRPFPEPVALDEGGW